MILSISTLCGKHSTITAFIGETITAGSAAFKAVPYVNNYLYNTEENQKIIRKHLKSSDSDTMIECEKYLSQACSDLAKHYRNLEEYHKISTLERELDKTENPKLQQIIGQSLKTARENKTKMNIPDDNGPYLQSLSEDEKNKTYVLMRTLIEENKNGIDNYAQELTYLYDSLNK